MHNMHTAHCIRRYLQLYSSSLFIAILLYQLFSSYFCRFLIEGVSSDSLYHDTLPIFSLLLLRMCSGDAVSKAQGEYLHHLMIHAAKKHGRDILGCMDLLVSLRVCWLKGCLFCICYISCTHVSIYEVYIYTDTFTIHIQSIRCTYL